ncbi:MAG: hypothetical protein N4A44_03650 [Alphaproteobacteria bacterium]|jgi:hypothetical protein|nr:hypothetical protein [Alphaproteobacteria bacterium]
MDFSELFNLSYGLGIMTVIFLLLVLFFVFKNKFVLVRDKENIKNDVEELKEEISLEETGLKRNHEELKKDYMKISLFSNNILTEFPIGSLKAFLNFLKKQNHFPDDLKISVNILDGEYELLKQEFGKDVDNSLVISSRKSFKTMIFNFSGGNLYLDDEVETLREGNYDQELFSKITNAMKRA